ncbi:TetR family transcriptional regulator [Streptomyces tsukubensis]|nr:TetR family transcriptional regulator [Streptomyces tsukubensis]
MIGAKRCMEELGYARTTSRDLAAAANVPLGSINYHYGSKDSLLNAALLEIVKEWGEKAVRSSSVGEAAGQDAQQRLERMWAQVIESVSANRPMQVASIEAFAQAERSSEVRDQIAAAYEKSRPELAAQLHGFDETYDEETARAVGSVHMALIAGLSMQWLIDPDHAPTAQQVAAGLRAIARNFEDN